MLNKPDAHAYIATLMEFPNWYGNNLDALWDMLSTYEAAEVFMVNSAAMLNALDTYGCRMLSCFYEAAEENKVFSFKLINELPEYDELFDDAVEFLLDGGLPAVSALQRRFSIGYIRAARLIDDMEARGIVSPYAEGSPRRVIITRDDWENMR